MTNKSKKPSVLLGLSGGVDSAIAAHLLLKQGFQVIGAFMKNYSDTKNPLTSQCTYLEDKKMAQRVASRLGIKLIQIDSEKEYKSQVLKPMFDLYSKGLTPNPDIPCNTIIKFPILAEHAKKHNCTSIATGHYAKIKKSKDGFSLHIPKDKEKDQTYFLSELTQKDLSHTIFPLQDLTKTQVRSLAKKLKLPNHDKRGTRGICFVGPMDFKKFLKKKVKPSPGKIKSPEGKTIGTHPGTNYFTIGERIGPRHNVQIDKEYLNKTKAKLYVAKKTPKVLTIAPLGHPSLKSSKIKLKKLHLLNPSKPLPKSGLKIRIRHLGPLHPGTLKKESSGLSFNLKKPLEQIAPGQKACIYHKTELVASAQIY